MRKITPTSGGNSITRIGGKDSWQPWDNLSGVGVGTTEKFIWSLNPKAKGVWKFTPFK
jgi:hypothetical protein